LTQLDERDRERAAKVQLILMDVDGVLTDARLYIDSEGRETKAFDARDGHGIRMGQQAGLSFGIISGRQAAAVSARAAELDITEVHQRIQDKIGLFQEILERLKLTADAVCYVGDDLIDLPVMRRVGFAAAPADALAEAQEAAHYVTRRAGGRGAVREVVDLVLRARGDWERVTRRYTE